jgi:hypothetical protein
MLMIGNPIRLLKTAIVGCLLTGCAAAPPGTLAKAPPGGAASTDARSSAAAPPLGSSVLAPGHRPLQLRPETNAVGGRAVEPNGHGRPPEPTTTEPLIPVLPGTIVQIAFDIRAIDVRSTQAERKGMVDRRTVAEGEIVERGIVNIPLDHLGRGVGSWNNRQAFPYFGGQDAPTGRYHPMVVDLGLLVAVAVQPSAVPGQRMVRFAASLDEVSELNADLVAGTMRPEIRQERYQLDLDIRDAIPVVKPFFVRPEFRSEIRLDMTTSAIR